MPEYPVESLSAVLQAPISGSRPSGGVESGADGIPSIGGENIRRNGGMRLDDVKRIPLRFFKQMPRGHLQPGDVLINKDGAQTGKVGQYQGEFGQASVNEHVFILRSADDQKLDQDYLYYCLLAPQVRLAIERRITGSAQPGLNSQFTQAVGIPLPAINRQRRIAEVMNVADAAIEKTEALIHKYQRIKAGLMHDLFTRGIGPDGQLRPPREQAPELYQETRIGWIPKGWQINPLRDSLTENPRNGLYKPAEQIGEGTLMIGQTAFSESRSVNFDLCRRGLVSESEARQFSVQEGDILVTRVFATVDGVGLPTLVPEVPETAVYESNMMRIRVNTTRTHPKALFEMLRLPALRRSLLAVANASNQVSINQAGLNGILIPAVEPDELNRQVDAVNAIDNKVEVEKRQLQKLRRMKAALIETLLSSAASN